MLRPSTIPYDWIAFFAPVPLKIRSARQGKRESRQEDQEHLPRVLDALVGAATPYADAGPAFKSRRPVAAGPRREGAARRRSPAQEVARILMRPYPKIINKAATSTRTTSKTDQRTKNRLSRLMRRWLCPIDQDELDPSQRAATAGPFSPQTLTPG